MFTIYKRNLKSLKRSFEIQHPLSREEAGKLRVKLSCVKIHM